MLLIMGLATVILSGVKVDVDAHAKKGLTAEAARPPRDLLQVGSTFLS